MSVDCSIQSSIHVTSHCIQTSMNVMTMFNPMLNHVCGGLSRCKMSVLNKNRLRMDTCVCQGMLIVMSVKWPLRASAKVEVFTGS